MHHCTESCSTLPACCTANPKSNPAQAKANKWAVGWPGEVTCIPAVHSTEQQFQLRAYQRPCLTRKHLTWGAQRAFPRPVWLPSSRNEQQCIQRKTHEEASSAWCAGCQLGSLGNFSLGEQPQPCTLLSVRPRAMGCPGLGVPTSKGCPPPRGAHHRPRLPPPNPSFDQHNCFISEE